MKVKSKYKTKDEIPEGLENLFKEVDGEWVLQLQVEGQANAGDVARLNTALTKERADHKAAKDKLAKFGDLDPEQVAEQLASIPELQAQVEAGGGKPDDAKIAQLVDAKVKRVLGPVERERDQLKAKVTGLEGQLGEATGTIVRTKVETAIRGAASELKVVGTAYEDVVAIGLPLFQVNDDGSVSTKEGIAPSAWLKDRQEKSPHWWPASVGGGAEGSNGGKTPKGKDNPWSADGWNITEQGRFVRQHGEEKAGQLAASVGSRLGATKPAPKAA